MSAHRKPGRPSQGRNNRLVVLLDAETLARVEARPEGKSAFARAAILRALGGGTVRWRSRKRGARKRVRRYGK